MRRQLWVLAVLVVLVIVIAVVLARGRKERYSVGFQIDPHYPTVGTTSTWQGIPYAMPGAIQPRSVACPISKSNFTSSGTGFDPYAPPDDENVEGAEDVPDLVYNPPFTQDLRGAHPNWWTPDGGSYGLPAASDRPDFWAGDATIHTYLAEDSIPPLCESAEVSEDRRRMTNDEWVEKWRYYGGPKGWNMSPFY
jgi:hypothetical protein